MHQFKELKVWQKSMDLVVDIYTVTTNFPTDEKFGLTSQLRRCAVSIPSNIAEGAGRDSEKEFLYFLSIALGSSFELETQLILSQRLNLLTKQNLEDLLSLNNYVQNMIVKLRLSLK
ncbi:MAG TPA: four helix bundle protein [Brumimicrobium sp.]|nr:four helix bundle protein [Brumimicrobium sp.]